MTGERDRGLWCKALEIAVAYAGGRIEEPPTARLETIGNELGGCIHDINDLKALDRIVRKIRGKNHAEI